MYALQTSGIPASFLASFTSTAMSQARSPDRLQACTPFLQALRASSRTSVISYTPVSMGVTRPDLAMTRSMSTRRMPLDKRNSVMVTSLRWPCSITELYLDSLSVLWKMFSSNTLFPES